jgi:hypothetical protein
MEQPAIVYRIRTVEQLKFFIDQKPSDFTGEEFQFDVKAQAKVNSDLHIVFIVVSIITRELGKEHVLSELVTALGFEIEDFEKHIVIDPDAGNFVIPDYLEVAIRTISISTSRGIMFGNLKGSYLHKAILPIIQQIVTPEEETIK